MKKIQMVRRAELIKKAHGKAEIEGNPLLETDPKGKILFGKNVSDHEFEDEDEHYTEAEYQAFHEERNNWDSFQRNNSLPVTDEDEYDLLEELYHGSMERRT